MAVEASVISKERMRLRNLLMMRFLAEFTLSGVERLEMTVVLSLGMTWKSNHI